MGDLWVTLGYDQIVVDIARNLRDGRDLRVIDGPPGVGKTSLTKGIGGLWELAAGATLVAEGDTARSEVPYYPFRFALTGLPAGWRTLVPAAEVAARAAEAMVGTYGILTSTVKGLAALGKRRKAALASLLTDPEQQIVHELRRLAQDKPILLIADNLHWWDQESLDLLRRLMSPQVQAAHPFLSDLRVLGVETTEPFQRVAHPSAHRSLLVSGRATRATLAPIGRDGFERVLVALGAPADTSADTADLLHALTGGHLALASRAAAELARGVDARGWASGAEDEFVRQLMTERIYALGAAGEQAAEMLQVAAVIGLVFRRAEITCATEASAADAGRLLRICRDALILDLVDDTARFVHDLFRTFFLEEAGDEVVAIHERLEDCLRTLRPAEYELRAVNAIAAERPRQAAALCVQALLARTRDGREPWQPPEEVAETLLSTGFDVVASGLATAWEAMRSYDFDASIAALERLPRDLPRVLLAEADYVRASCLLATRSEDDRAMGRLTLEAWDGLLAEEPELGSRISRLLVYGLSHLHGKEPGRRLENRLRHELGDRSVSDPSAKDAAYSLDRSSASLYSSDVALVRIEEAVSHFGRPSQDDELRRPLESYRSLVNLVASLISNGRYGLAVEQQAELDLLLDRYPDGTFPRPDFPAMNAVLAEYRAGHIDAAEAVSRHETRVRPRVVASDPFYSDNALAVFLALAGRAEEGFERVTASLELLRRSRRDPEPSMEYLLRANACAIGCATGSSSASEWRELADLVRRINYTSGPMLIRRHELLTELFDSGKSVTPQDLDVWPIQRSPHEFGPLWDNFGRGFRMPEVEFWREG
ncbi:MAG: AAA family ATPase [Microthrixaceae bacterium]